MDKEYWALHQALFGGTPPVEADCKEYFQYRDRMYPRNGVLLLEDRLVIPAGLRPKVLTVLHAAHQGKSTMLHRAAQTVFWPGYTIDVQKKRELLDLQQHHTDAVAGARRPFRANLFNLAGVHYLVTIDRLSGWLDVIQAAARTARAGGKGPHSVPPTTLRRHPLVGRQN